MSKICVENIKNTWTGFWSRCIGTGLQARILPCVAAGTITGYTGDTAAALRVSWAITLNLAEGIVPVLLVCVVWTDGIGCNCGYCLLLVEVIVGLEIPMLTPVMPILTPIPIVMDGGHEAIVTGCIPCGKSIGERKYPPPLLHEIICHMVVFMLLVVYFRYQMVDFIAKRKQRKLMGNSNENMF